MSCEEFEQLVQAKFPDHAFVFPHDYSGLYPVRIAKSYSNKSTMVVVNWSRNKGWQEEVTATAIL